MAWAAWTSSACPARRFEAAPASRRGAFLRPSQALRRNGAKCETNGIAQIDLSFRSHVTYSLVLCTRRVLGSRTAKEGDGRADETVDKWRELLTPCSVLAGVALVLLNHNVVRAQQSGKPRPSPHTEFKSKLALGRPRMQIAFKTWPADVTGRAQRAFALERCKPGSSPRSAENGRRPSRRGGCKRLTRTAVRRLLARGRCRRTTPPRAIPATSGASSSAASYLHHLKLQRVQCRRAGRRTAPATRSPRATPGLRPSCLSLVKLRPRLEASSGPGRIVPGLACLRGADRSGAPSRWEKSTGIENATCSQGRADHRSDPGSRQNNGAAGAQRQRLRRPTDRQRGPARAERCRGRD